jgi:hypothetical protein
MPDLDGMNSDEAREFLIELFSDLSADAEFELRHEDFVMEMPQSGERIRGRDAMRRFQEAFAVASSPPSIQINRVIARDGVWFVEGLNDYGEGNLFNVVLVLELKDGKMWRDTRYYAEPFEAPEWRSHLVERM